MATTQLDYGVIQEKSSGRTKAVWIKGTTIGGIHTEYCGSSGYYDQMKWKVVYRGSREGYTGPKPDSAAI